MSLTYGSVCSGIEAVTIAWEPLGFKPVWFSEVEPFPSAVLHHHYPSVLNAGDMTFIPKLVEYNWLSSPDIIVGGTPCQSFSVAGLRNGVSDDRGNLTLKFVELTNEIDNTRRTRNEPGSIIVWENVPGVLSSKDNAFGQFLAGLVGESEPLEPAGKRWTNAGYVSGPQRTAAWRVLDAQYFGVAQRRRRVFVVASARAGFDPAAVLFESEGVRRDTAPSREAWEEVAGTVGKSAKAASHWNGDNPHPALNQSHNTGGIGASNQELFSQRDAGIVPHGFRMVAFGEYADDQTAGTMKSRDYKDATDLVVSVRGTQDPCIADSQAHTLVRNNGGENAILADRVRRLIPVECERLQGFPDNHTLIPWRNKPADQCPDGPRYKAIGNSMAVPVMQWIGQRIKHEVNLCP